MLTLLTAPYFKDSEFPMKARRNGEGTGPNYTEEQRALFDEPHPVGVCFSQLVGKRYLYSGSKRGVNFPW